MIPLLLVFDLQFRGQAALPVMSVSTVLVGITLGVCLCLSKGGLMLMTSWYNFVLYRYCRESGRLDLFSLVSSIQILIVGRISEPGTDQPPIVTQSFCRGV